ncbi:MAG: alpha/beta fold hydrolase [Flavisolibacter sp.]
MRQSSALLLSLAMSFMGLPAFCQQAQDTKEENVVYGMVSGTALLMDVYKPAKPNHRAIIYIVGSAWGLGYAKNYDQVPLKDDIILDSSYTGQWKNALVQNGYTVFVINHRFAPKFQFRDIIEDCRRAVRFVRYHARQYDIDPARIGAMGHSSGGNLASMLGLTDSVYVANKSPIDSVSSKVQAVVTLAAPFNLADINKYEDSAMANNYLMAAIASYMGSLPEIQRFDFALSGKYVEASPYAQVTADDAPTLMYYSDNDPVIAVRQAQEMYKELVRNNVPAKIFSTHNAGHFPIPDMAEVCRWFEKYL